MPESRKKRVELQVRRRASDWARAKLDFEAKPSDEPGLKQITVRMQAEDVALVDALAKRLGVSRNEAVGVFIGSGAADAYEQLPDDDRKAIVAQVAETLGQEVDVRWVRELPGEDILPPDMLDRMRYQP